MYALVTLELKHRQDFVQIITNLFLRVHDKMILDVLMQPAEPIMIVFAICKKTQTKWLHNNLPDLKNYAKKYNKIPSHNFPEEF